jgi:hypothetical protein
VVGWRRERGLHVKVCVGSVFWMEIRLRPLRHEPEVNYADGASGVISEPLRRLACRSPLISFSGARFTNHLFVRHYYRRYSSHTT